MTKTDSIYLEDIENAIHKIDRYLADVTFEQFVSDELRQDGVIRQLEIIGEAANHLSADFAHRNPQFPLRDAVDMRNFLIHGYDSVDIETVWATCKTNLPSLLKYIQSL